jgi:hypothetical protein
MALLQVLLGVAVAVVVGGFGSRVAGRLQLALYALGLVGAALVYVGLAAFNGGREQLPLEALGLALYTLVAVLGVGRWPPLLVVGWAGHAAWDLLHPGGYAPYVPGWYPPACIGFDLAVAAYLAWLLWRRGARAG